MANTYTFSVYFVDDNGQPITSGDAQVVVSAFDENSLEWLDFNDNTFKNMPTTKETNATNNGDGIFSLGFDTSTWGNRRVHFTALCTYSTISRLIERLEVFEGGVFIPQGGVVLPDNMYVSVEEVRKFGITTDIVPLDTDIIRLIKHASLQIDKFTGQWFNLRNLTLPIKYFGGRYIYLPTLLVNLESIVYEDDDTFEISVDDVKLYNRIPEDYEDPRIYLKYPPPLPHPLSTPTLSKNEITFEITGDWGVVEDSTGTILEPIKRACLLTIMDLLGYDTSNYDSTSWAQPYIIMETTDRHQYTLSSEKMREFSHKPTILPMAARIILEPFRAPLNL